MKTILIAHNYTLKSFACSSYSLAHYLGDLGYRVIFISHRPYFNEKKVIKKKKGEIILFSWKSSKRPTTFSDAIWYFKIYLKYKPKFVIGHFVGSNITCLISKIFSLGKVKTIIYYHTLSSQILLDNKKSFLKTKFLFFRKKLFYLYLTDYIICPSNFAKKDLNEYFSVNKGKVILNPMVDRYESNKNDTSKEIIISYLGRLNKSKGILELIEAYKTYFDSKQNSKIVLKIAGNGNLSNEIIKRINNYDSIKYVGGLDYDDVDEYLSSSNYTIIPSIIDNLPTVGIESLMNKTPLLISNNTGLSEYLIDGKDCLKFSPNINSIIETLKRVENISTLEYNNIADNARSSFIEKFSLIHYYKEITSIIK